MYNYGAVIDSDLPLKINLSLFKGFTMKITNNIILIMAIWTKN